MAIAKLTTRLKNKPWSTHYKP